MSSSLHDSGMERGIAHLSARLAKVGLKIVARERRWPGRMATYLMIGLEGGKPEENSDIVLTDEFICDLPRTLEHQIMVDSYVDITRKRLGCGSPHSFYCQSGIPIRAEIIWPTESEVLGSEFLTWFRLELTDLRHGNIARCTLRLSEFRSGLDTTFILVKSAVNQARVAVDSGSVMFYAPHSHPQVFQRVAPGTPSAVQATALADIERFIAGKVYWFGFRLDDSPRDAWIYDPWDANYLGINFEDMKQAVHILRGKGLIDLNEPAELARPTENFIAKGWPAALDGPSRELLQE